jgi:drug/metabolite transporter (DMT)-like permease
VICCLSTLLYSCSNLILRGLTGSRLAPDWILFFKELVCVVSVTPIILLMSFAGKYRRPRWKWILCIVLGGTVCEAVGAELQLWAYNQIGVVITIPLIQTANLIGAAAIGFVCLREILCRRDSIAVGVLILSMFCLVFGPPTEPSPVAREAGLPMRVVLGGIGAVLSGAAYSVHVVFLRYASESREMPISLMMVIVTGIGMIVFGSSLWLRHGIAGFYEGIPASAWKWCFLTGVINTAAFYFQILGLRYTILARAQLIAVGQIALITVVGILYFGEPANALVWGGIALAILGILIIGKPDRAT